MNELDFLNKKLTTEELDKFLYEIMGYRATPYEYPSRYKYGISISDEDGDDIPYENMIGFKDVSIVKNALLFKEKIDENRGKANGITIIQEKIKDALGFF